MKRAHKCYEFRQDFYRQKRAGVNSPPNRSAPVSLFTKKPGRGKIRLVSFIIPLLEGSGFLSRNSDDAFNKNPQPDYQEDYSAEDLHAPSKMLSEPPSEEHPG